MTPCESQREFFWRTVWQGQQAVWKLQKNPPPTLAEWLGRFLGLFTGVRVDLASSARKDKVHIGDKAWRSPGRRNGAQGGGLVHRERKVVYFIQCSYLKWVCKKEGFMAFQWNSPVSVCSTDLCIAALHWWGQLGSPGPLEVRSNEDQFHYPSGVKCIEDGKQMRSERSLKQDSLPSGKTK